MKLKNMLKLAQAIKEHTTAVPITFGVGEFYWLHRDSFVNALCDILKADNPLFNAEKFKELTK